MNNLDKYIIEIEGKKYIPLDVLPELIDKKFNEALNTLDKINLKIDD